jgi:hypothetical protein
LEERGVGLAEDLFVDGVAILADFVAGGVARPAIVRPLAPML